MSAREIFDSYCTDFSNINDEIEIIEEDEPIEKLKNKRFTRNQKQIANKINELIDEVNKLKKKENE